MAVVVQPLHSCACALLPVAACLGCGFAAVSLLAPCAASLGQGLDHRCSAARAVRLVRWRSGCGTAAFNMRLCGCRAHGCTACVNSSPGGAIAVLHVRGRLGYPTLQAVEAVLWDCRSTVLRSTGNCAGCILGVQPQVLGLPAFWWWHECWCACHCTCHIHCCHSCGATSAKAEGALRLRIRIQESRATQPPSHHVQSIIQPGVNAYLNNPSGFVIKAYSHTHVLAFVALEVIAP